MSNGADCVSTRAVVVDPSGRRMVTLVLDDTTCTFVTTVSDVTKNPEPRPDDVSTTTAPAPANATIVRATAAPVLRVGAGLASSTGEVTTDWRFEPHRQVATLGGTRRPHSGHTQLAADGSRSVTIRFSAVYRVRRLTHVYRFASDGRNLRSVRSAGGP